MHNLNSNKRPYLRRSSVEPLTTCILIIHILTPHNLNIFITVTPRFPNSTKQQAEYSTYKCFNAVSKIEHTSQSELGTTLEAFQYTLNFHSHLKTNKQTNKQRNNNTIKTNESTIAKQSTEKKNNTKT